MSNIFKRGILGSCALSIAVLGASTAADAAGFYIREHSTSAAMTGFAGSASRGDDASHLFYNPATIVKNSKLDITSDYRIFFPDVAIDTASSLSPLGMPTGGALGTGNIAPAAGVAPAFYASYAYSDRLSFGFGGSGPFAVEIDAGQTWAGRFHVTKTSMKAFNFNPVVAYKLTDWLTVGGGLQVQYFNANLQNITLLPAPFPLGTTAPGYLVGDDWGFGFTAGVLIEPTESTTIGVGYRSRIKHEVKGRAGAQAPGIPVERSKFDFTSPDVLTASVSHQLNDYIALHGTFEWANWSLFDDITVEFGSGRPNEVRRQDWEDTYSGFAGASVMMNEDTMFGAGLGYTTAVSDGSTSSISPDGNRFTLSMGVSHRVMKSLTLKASYSHIFFEDTTLNIVNPAAGTLRGKSKIDINVVGFSSTLHW